jgi:glycosyltransferase involved in cell wall biosynthesis
LPFPVLHTYADYKWTGPSEPLACVLRALGARGWRADLACMADDPAEPRTLPRTACQWGINVLDGFSFRDWPHVREAFADVALLARRIEEGGYRMVHCHGTWDQLIAARALRRLGRPVPLVRTDHAARDYHDNLRDRWFYGPRLCDHLIVLADRYRAQAVNRIGRAPESVSRVRGAVDVNEWRPMEPPEGLRRSLGFSESDVVIGLVARVQPKRRFDVIIAAADIVRRRNPHVKLLVLGRGTRKQELLDRPVRERGLENTVISGGYRRDDFRDVLATFDAGLMLVPGSDGSCRAAMQMAAMAKALVVAQRGVLPEIVIDGETGIAVDDTPPALADALLEMAEDADRRLRWGQAARRRMEEHFSLERQVSDLEEVYARVAAAHGA